MINEIKRQRDLLSHIVDNVVAQGGNMLKRLNLVKAKIKELTNEECERDFSGNDAYALSVLYDAFSIGGDE